MLEFATSMYERAESYDCVVKSIPHRADEFIDNFIRDGFALLELLKEVHVENEDLILFILTDAVDYLNHQLDYTNDKVWALKIAVEEWFNEIIPTSN